MPQNEENTNKFEKNIKQLLVYKIDLKNDIDHGKYPQNEINQTEEYLEFVCEKGTEISVNDFKDILGLLEEKDDYLRGILQKQSLDKHKDNLVSKKIFNAILPLCDKYDILSISFRGKPEQRFNLSVYNDYMYQLVQGSEKEFSNNSDEDTSSQAHCVTFNFEKKNNLSVLKNRHLSEYIFSPYNYQDTVSFYLDYKLGKININNYKWRNASKIYSVNFENLNYFEMRVSFPDNVSFDNLDNNDFFVYKIRYAKNKGYIYLKPIILKKGNYKICLHHTEKTTLEYYLEKSAEWKIIPDKFYLTEKENLRLRIKMNAGGRLHDLFIVKDEKEK